MTKIWIKSLTALLLGLLLTWVYFFVPMAFYSLNNNLRDFLFIVRGELPKSEQVVIVDIDEMALKQFGQWPWPRTIVADLLNSLSDAEAGIIGLDIVFAEADQTSPHRIASKIKGNTATLENYDLILAQSLATTPTVGGYIFTFRDDGSVGVEGPMIPATFIEKGFDANPSIIRPDGVVLNLDVLQENLYSSGFFNNLPDEGGMIRRVPLVMRYEGMLYPSLALEMFRIYNDISSVDVDADDAGVEKIRIGDLTIPTDFAGRLIVNFRGPGKHFKYISAADIINGTFTPKDIAGKFVLIGTSAVGLYDLRSIPFDSTIAGVEVHANVLDNLLTGDFLSALSDVWHYDLSAVFSIIIIIFVSLFYLESWVMLPAVIGASYLLFKLALSVTFTLGIVVNLLFPLLAFVLSLVLSVGIDYIIASRQRESVKRIFAKKVSKAVMEDLVKNGDEDILKVRDADVAVFFSDIRGFTAISETIGSSQRLIELLNRYMTPVVEEIAEHEGTVDKFIGDAIMAYWNAPNHVEDYADKAVTSSLAQITMLERLNIELEKEFGVSLSIGIGIHTGSVTVGEMGSTGRSDYTIIGDNVNLASRLEGLNKNYGSTIIISEDAKKMLKREYQLRSLDLVRVKGKEKAVEVFEVISSDETLKSSDELEAYADALEVYRDENIDEAYARFQSLAQNNPCKLYDIYLERCEHYQAHPELAFDVIHTMQDK